MSKKTLRVLFVSCIMILTSLAGCIDSSEDSSGDANQSDEYYGTIMTSTYHVEQLVSAIVGDTATVDMMSTSNIPVHDYRVTTIDTERLKSSDVFFYHGLELEPWVGGILSSEGIPPSYMTHTMPTGEITLDYQTMLVNDLCEQLNSGAKESNTLLSYEDQADQLEIHPEKGIQTLTFPDADTSHDGHDHDDDHDDHSDGSHDDHDDHDSHDDHDDHDDHDGHGEHAHTKPEKVINNPVNCPANTVISVFHLEEGEHVVEFETNWWARTSFDVAALPMMGGHAHHHDHGHGDGHDDHNGEITPEEALSEFDTDGDGNLSWSEFWVAWTTDDDDHDDHEDDDVEEHGDDDHDDHSPLEEAIEEYQMGMLMPMFNESDVDNSGGLSLDELEHFIEDIDAMEDADSDMPTGEFIVSAFDENNDIMLSFEEFSEMMGMEHDDHGDDETHDENETSEEALIEAMMQMTFATFDANNDSYLNASEIDMMFEMTDDGDDHHQEGGGDHGHQDSHGDEGGNDDHAGEEGHESHGGHDDHDEPYCHTPDHVNTDHSNREDCEAAGNIWMAGEPNDGTRGYLTIHVENEGDYGFAVPSDISVFILMGDGHEGHDHGGHDGHAGHDNHDDDAHDEDEHDDADGSEDGATTEDGYANAIINADADEDEFEYDPHSWLDPVAFKAQAQLVLDALIEVFPNGTTTFTANAEAFMAELDKVHLGYIDAFGPEGTCVNKIAAANHNAYSYITERYGVEFVTVHGLDPEGEPSAADIDKVISKINEDQINVLFIEEYTQASSVDIIVDATGVEVMYLYTMEKSPSDSNDNYLTMINKNLDNLKTGLGCAV